MIAIPYWLGGKNQREPSWIEVRRCIRLGMLSGKLLITPLDLQRTTGLSKENSVTLIMDARKEEMNEITLAAESAEQEALTNAMISFTNTSVAEAFTTGELNTVPTPVQDDIYAITKALNIPLVSLQDYHKNNKIGTIDSTSPHSNIKGITDISNFLSRIEAIHSQLLLYKKLHEKDDPYVDDSETNKKNLVTPPRIFMFPIRTANITTTDTTSNTIPNANEFRPMTI